MAKANLFTRLTISVFIAVLISITLTKTLVDYYDTKEEIHYLTRDVNYLIHELDIKAMVGDPTQDHQVMLPAPHSYHFLAAWQHNPKSKHPCTQCKLHVSSSNVKFYRIKEEKWVVSYEPKDMPGRLLIFNEEQETHPEIGDEYEPSESYGFVVFFSLTFVTVALFIYRPINQLQKQIRNLIKTNQAFGAGDLSVRADAGYSPPLHLLSTSFNKMADAIAESVNESQIFAQAIPHEVRTPLSRIQLASGLLKQQMTDRHHQELLEDIERNILDIDQLVNQVLTYSRLQLQEQTQCTLPVRQIHILSFLNARLKLLTCQHPHSSDDTSLDASDTSSSLTPESADGLPELVLNVDEDLYFTGDVILLRLILDNLIKNALRYTRTHLWITVSSCEKGIKLCIEDNGEGIPERERQKIFVPFSRLDNSRNRKTGGLGLGLAIVKLAVNKSQGNIEVSRSQHGGAHFQVNLPLQSGAPTSQANA